MYLHMPHTGPSLFMGHPLYYVLTKNYKRKRRGIPSGCLGKWAPSCLVRGPGPWAPEDEDTDRFCPFLSVNSTVTTVTTFRYMPVDCAVGGWSYLPLGNLACVVSKKSDMDRWIGFGEALVRAFLPRTREVRWWAAMSRGISRRSMSAQLQLISYRNGLVTSLNGAHSRAG